MSSCAWVPMGGSCAGAVMLRRLGIRREAYPLDWVISSTPSVLSALTSGFVAFHTRMRPLPASHLHAHSELRLEDAYGIVYLHDYPHQSPGSAEGRPPRPELEREWESHVPAVNAKYSRRVERLLAVLRGPQDVVLIHTPHTLHRRRSAVADAVQLLAAVETTYGKRNIAVVVTTHAASTHPRVVTVAPPRRYFGDDFDDGWRVPDEAWVVALQNAARLSRANG